MKFNFYIAQIARGGYSWEFLVGNLDVPSGSSNPDPVSDQKCYFQHSFSDQTSKIQTRFQTWPVGRNYVIIT